MSVEIKVEVGAVTPPISLVSRTPTDTSPVGASGAPVADSSPLRLKATDVASTFTSTDTVLAANACFGHDLPAEARSAGQQRRLDQFLAVTGIPQSFINTDIGFFTTFAMADMVHDPDKLGGRIGTGNRNVDYGDPFINAKIQRVGANAKNRRRLRDN